MSAPDTQTNDAWPQVLILLGITGIILGIGIASAPAEDGCQREMIWYALPVLLSGVFAGAAGTWMEEQRNASEDEHN